MNKESEIALDPRFSGGHQFETIKPMTDDDLDRVEVSSGSDDSLGYEFERLFEELGKREHKIKKALKKSNTIRSIQTVMITLTCTCLLFMIQKSKNDIELNDYKSFSKIFGGYDNTVKYFDTKTQSDDMFEKLDKISNLNSLVFQQLDYSKAKIRLQILNRELGASLETNLNDIDITDINNGKLNRETFSKTHNLPFDLNNIVDFQNNSYDIGVIAIKFDNIKFISYNEAGDPTCRSWYWTTNYSFESNGVVSGKNSVIFVRCSSFEEECLMGNQKIVASIESNWSVIIVNTISFIGNVFMLALFVRVVINIYKLKSLKQEKWLKEKWLKRNKKNTCADYAKIHNVFDYEAKLDQHDVHINPQKDVPGWVVLEIKSFWTISYCVSAISFVIANLIIYIEDFHILHLTSSALTAQDFFLGLGLFLTWVNLLYVLGYHPPLRITSNQFSYATPQFGQFLIAILPIFFAYVYFGYVMFNEGNDRYNNQINVLISLIALIGGDEVQNNLTVYKEMGIFGNLFGYSFCLLFQIILHNVIVLIITEGYDKAFEEQEAIMEKREKKLQMRKTIETHKKNLNKMKKNLKITDGDGNLMEYKHIKNESENELTVKQGCLVEYHSEDDVCNKRQLSKLKKYKEKGLDIDSQVDKVFESHSTAKKLMNQIEDFLEPETDLKVHQLWRRIQHLNKTYNEFKECLKDVHHDPLIKDKEDMSMIMTRARFYIEFIRFKVENIREKSWRYLRINQLNNY